MIKDDIILLIKQMNPWIEDPGTPIFQSKNYIPRYQAPRLLLPEWDKVWTILTGPRQTGKTTLGLFLCQSLVEQKRFDQLIYLSCDQLAIREWIKDTLFLREIMEYFSLEHPILFIDEVQRLENPGLLLKAIADMKLPIKMIASGSSQLEIKSKVQEFLTGRQFESLILPLSYQEMETLAMPQLVYGCYPGVVAASEKRLVLQQLYQDYISKDIVEFLKIGKPDNLQRLITLIAHSAGQLVNYQQLANDCGITLPTIKHYLEVLEQTYVLKRIQPFVGNKRKEITANPVYYFIDNGFRNQALRNFSSVEMRSDSGLLFESAVFQDILKCREQRFLDFDIHFWRTQSGGEVDFVLYQNMKNLIPIEVKFRGLQRATVSRAFRSFIQAYKPKVGMFITKDFNTTVMVEGCEVHFISAMHLHRSIQLIEEIFS